MSIIINVDSSKPDSLNIQSYKNVVGHVLVAVVKQPDGALSIERDIAVNCDSAEDNETVEQFVKGVERHISDILPEPEKAEEPSKIWVPS